MKRDCTECNRPLFGQNTPDDSDLCDNCWTEKLEENETL